VRQWGQARLPNSLRFKVRQAPNEPKKVVGVVFHVPCLPPPQFAPDTAAIAAVWQHVHRFLDAPAQNLSRIPE
jgi:CRISPR-associated protein Cmr1